MVYVKKLVMQGFKSFARKTEIPFENAMNVIVGPNGSGKSNITDALCFVLGRISIKSIRAAKAANLIFSGNKQFKASQEASVSLVFENDDRSFSIDSREVSIQRIVRRNGQSIYKINGETKTRQELLELLAQAGIDPHGFNIVLQGEIASLIKLSPDERRKIIEEVAGISIYETRKSKSLRELEKGEERLKEVSTILKEKSAYLRNLEKERQEVLTHQKLEETVKRCKATILRKKIKDKRDETAKIETEIENEKKAIEKIKSEIDKKTGEIAVLEDKTKKINKLIQESTSSDQETLYREISESKSELAGLSVRKENFVSRLEQNDNKSNEFSRKLEDLELELDTLRSSSPKLKQEREILKEKETEFDFLEKKRREFYMIKSEIGTLENKRDSISKEILEDKKELELIEKNIDSLSKEIKYEKSYEKAVELKANLDSEIERLKEKIENSRKNILEIEKDNAILKQVSERESKLRTDITNLEVCPLCRSEMTEEHVGHVIQGAKNKIDSSEKKLKENLDKKDMENKNLEELERKFEELKTKIGEIELDIVKIENSEERKNQIKKLVLSKTESEGALRETNENLSKLQSGFEKLKDIEERYEEARLKIHELSFANVDTDTEISVKQREVERLKVEIKAISRDNEESERELREIDEKINEQNKIVIKKEKEEQELYEKSQKLFEERNSLQDSQKAIETLVMGLQNDKRSHEDKINNHNIGRAQNDAQRETFESELKEFESFESISGPIEQIIERMNKAQFKLSQTGNINLRALEVYDSVKESVEAIEERVGTLEKEREKIFKIITEIDKKKKKAFMTSLASINEYFTRNFTQLSKKGEVFLELENKQDPFDGGLNILVRVGRGKYFDVTSLSGGEKTLVALSLIFAIQEYKPYCFYIFDEIDAALDKHNSELLAALIKKYMVSGQYIVISHNDALISEASALYGVSMQENISKVISLKMDEEEKKD